MPMYEYACRACNHVFMAQRSTAERDNAPTCPTCSGTNVGRQLATFMIRNGSGSPAMAGVGAGAGGAGDACAAPMGPRSHGFGCACCS